MIENTSMYSFQLGYSDGRFFCNMNLKIVSIKICERATVGMLIQFKTIRPIKVSDDTFAFNCI